MITLRLFLGTVDLSPNEVGEYRRRLLTGDLHATRRLTLHLSSIGGTRTGTADDRRAGPRTSCTWARCDGVASSNRTATFSVLRLCVRRNHVIRR